MNRAIFSEKRVDLLQLIIDLARVAASQQHKKIQRIIVELEFSFFRAPPDDLGRFLFPAASAGIEAIEYLHVCSLEQRLVKRATLVHFGGADQKRDLVT